VQVFVLSPASCSGRRAALVLEPRARFDLARRLRSRSGVVLGEVFSFLSGLYFRGKLAYARAFACPPPGVPGIFVITPDRGLVSPDHVVRASTLRAFAAVPIDGAEARYTGPLARDVGALARRLPPGCRVVLLGSVATDKYVRPLESHLGSALVFPIEFVGRGDMSRGGLMLRCVEDRQELTYVGVADTPRHGPPPPRLAPRRLPSSAPGL
jgi:hypothetical protein